MKETTKIQQKDMASSFYNLLTLNMLNDKKISCRTSKKDNGLRLRYIV